MSIIFHAGPLRIPTVWEYKPRNVQVTAISTTELYVFWPAVAGAFNYDVRIDGGTPLTIQGSNDGILGGLDPNTTYSIDVSVAGQGNYSVAQTGTTDAPEITYLTTPIGLQVVATSDTAFTFEWQAVDGADGYTVDLDGGTATAIGNSTQHTFGGLSPNTSYDARVRATSSDEFVEDSPWTTPFTVTTAPPAPVEQAVANVIGRGTITVRRNGRVVGLYENRPIAAFLLSKDMAFGQEQTLKYIDVMGMDFRQGSDLANIRAQIGWRDDLSQPVQWEPEFDIQSLSDIHFTRFTAKYVRVQILAESLSAFWRLGNLKIYGRTHGKRF